MILHPGPNRRAADADSIIYRHGKRNVQLHFDGILPIVCPTARVMSQDIEDTANPH